MKKYCNSCGKLLSRDSKGELCYNCRVLKNREDTINHWLLTGDTGCGVATTLRNAIRDYIYWIHNTINVLYVELMIIGTVSL